MPIPSVTQRLSQNFVTAVGQNLWRSDHLTPEQKHQAWELATAYKAAAAAGAEGQSERLWRLGTYIWDALEADYVGRFRQQGIRVRQTVDAISIPSTDTPFRLIDFLNSIVRVTRNYSTDIMVDYSTTVTFPTTTAFRRLLATEFGMLEGAVQFVSGNIDAADIFELHRQRRVPIGLPLGAIFLADVKTDVHPFEYIMHELYHAIRLYTHTPETLLFVETLYDLATAADRLVPGSSYIKTIRESLADLDANTINTTLVDLMSDFKTEWHSDLIELVFVSALRSQVANWNWPTALRQEALHLQHMLTDRVNGSLATAAEMTRAIEKTVEADFVRNLQGTFGVKKVEVDREQGRISVHYHKSVLGDRNGDLESFDPLYAAHHTAKVLNLVLGIDPIDITDALNGIFHIPTADHMRAHIETHYADRLPGFQYVAHEVSRDELHQAHARNTAVLRLQLVDSVFLDDLQENVHAWIYYMHDWYHAIAFTIFRPEDRQLATQMYEAIAHAVAQGQSTSLTAQMQDTLVDMENPYAGVGNVLDRTLLPLERALRDPQGMAVSVYGRLLEIENAELAHRLQRMQPTAWQRGK